MINTTFNKIKILCSGVALGVYIPGVSLCYQLRKLGYEAEVVVLENLLPDAVRDKIPETKNVFHSNFRLAQMGQKIARDITPSLDKEKTEQLFFQWENDHTTLYVLLSGFWLPLFENYGVQHLLDSRVMILHVDSVPSPSWKFLQKKESGAYPVFLFDYQSHKLNFKLKVTEQSPLPFEQRENRFLIHGGGWGMGTYRNAVSTLEHRGAGLDIVAYSENEAFPDKAGERYYLVDPDWHPWVKNHENEHTFPPVSSIEYKVKPQFYSRAEYHELYYVGACNKAIISKPGGSTLVDSLASATPFVFLDSWGQHEDFNAALWIEMGLGITFQTWEKSDFSDELLKTCHSNLVKIWESTPDFVTALTNKKATMRILK